MIALEERGYDSDRLEDMRILIDAKDSDIFDVLAYVRFSLDPITRKARAENARGAGLEGYELEMRDFLKDVLYAYERDGVAELGYGRLADLLRVRYGSTNDAKRILGELPTIKNAFGDVQRYIYGM